MSPNEAPGDVVRWLQQSSADKSPAIIFYPSVKRSGRQERQHCHRQANANPERDHVVAVDRGEHKGVPGEPLSHVLPTPCDRWRRA